MGSRASWRTRAPSPSLSRKTGPSGRRRIPSTMIAAVEKVSTTLGSRTADEGSNRYSPDSHSNAEKTISSTRRFISSSLTARDEFLSQPRSLMTGGLVQRPPDFVLRNAASPAEEGAEALSLAGRRRD